MSDDACQLPRGCRYSIDSGTARKGVGHGVSTTSPACGPAPQTELSRAPAEGRAVQGRPAARFSLGDEWRRVACVSRKIARRFARWQNADVARQWTLRALFDESLATLCDLREHARAEARP